MYIRMTKPKCFINMYLKAPLLLRAKFFQNGTLVGSRLEIALVTSELDPGVPLLLVGLEEWRPLHDVAEFTPSFRLLEWRKMQLRIL